MIKIANLQKIIDQRTALDIDALQVAAGEVAGVIGIPGSGIEILFDLLTGKLRPSAGTIHLAQVTPAEKDQFSRKVGILFPGDALYMRQTPEANLSLLGQIYGLPKSRAREVLERIGMADQAGARLEKLPPSLLRRLAFGRAILHGPAILLLYEPFSRCDEATSSSRAVWPRCQRLQKITRLPSHSRFPAGFDRAVQARETLELQGYVMRWVNEKDAETLRRLVEVEIAALLGQPVTINLQGNRIDLLPESDGVSAQAAFGLAFVLIMIGVLLVPHLMLDEKQSGTLAALSISPASAGHIVAGKTLAGLFYCVLGGLTALALNRGLVVHWWLAVFTLLAGALFTVSLGLWLGVKIDSRAELSMWAWVVLLLLILPILFSLLEGLIPTAWVRFFSLVPSSVILQLSRTACANPIPLGKSLLLLAWVAVAAGGVLAVVAWTLHRRDRESGVFAGPWPDDQAARASEGSQGFLGSLWERHAPWGVARPPKPLAALQPDFTDEPVLHEDRRPGRLAIIGILAAKDLLDALKNRLILSVLLGSAFILLSSAALPLLLSLNSIPQMVVFDPGRSTFIHSLAGREDFWVGVVTSQDEMERVLTRAQNLTLGLTLPADFDQQAGRGGSITLDAAYPHWAGSKALAQQTAFFAAQLNQAAGVQVNLDLAGHVIYPPPKPEGRSVMVLLNLVAVILVIGIALVPLLIIEEKESQTLKVLLVSPAGIGQVMVGKALVGLFYSLLPGLGVLLVYHAQFVHWEIAILALLLSAALAVVAGLMLGVYAGSPTTVSLWGGVLLLLMLGSAFLNLFPALSLPPAVASALDWMPGAAMLQLFSLSQAGELPAGLLWLNVGALLAAIVVFSGLVAWRVYKIEV